ncbi:glycerol kinase GlpK [Haliangium sp.]|uniref:glycerol kinase GlpK n=1 Tax=Haliangium sp. TaxID=2663208 RepID=UPI003D09986D
MRHVVAIDQGTTGTTVLVIDEQLRVIGRATQEFRQIYPHPGWVEHDPEDIWTSVVQALGAALADAGVSGDDITAIGITNQRETTVLWERAGLRPVRNAIVWQDRRTADICARLKQGGHEDLVRAKTGLIFDPYFSGTKLAWMLDEDQDRRRRAGAGELAFGTVDAYLVARLTAGEAFITDVSNASRTLFMDLATLSWDDQLLGLLDIPRELLPDIACSSEVYGHTRGVPGLPDGVPIAGIAGDQQAALFGQACFSPGDAKCTYGTGAFLLMNTGAEVVASNAGLLTTVAWKLGAGAEAGEVCYALEGAAFVAGAVVQWLRDELGLVATAADIEPLARSVEDAGEVIMVPALAGLGAPHWRPQARGLITGLTRGTTKAHLARAALDGIALQNYDILKAMERDAGRPLEVLKVDGGASANDLLMQFQSDVLGVAISRPAVVETTALGAAFLAGLATGVWQSKADIAAAWREDRRFEPVADRAAVDAHLARWNEAVAKA